MASYAPSLPLTIDGQDGFVNIKDFGHLIKQNLKMLVLTNQGERIMMPNFGIGLKKILFEIANGDGIVLNNVEFYGDIIDSKDFLLNLTKNQIERYMSSIVLDDVEIDNVPDSNSTRIVISYNVPDIGISDSIVFIADGGTLITEKMPVEQSENLKRIPKSSNRDRLLVSDATFDTVSDVNSDYYEK